MSQTIRIPVPSFHLEHVGCGSFIGDVSEVLPGLGLLPLRICLIHCNGPKATNRERIYEASQTERDREGEVVAWNWRSTEGGTITLFND